MAYDAFDLYSTLQKMIPLTGTESDLVGVPVILSCSHINGSTNLEEMEPVACNKKPVSLTLRDYVTEG